MYVLNGSLWALDWAWYPTETNLRCPQSPDLNPIQHLWEELDKNIRKHEISSKNDFKKALMGEWGKISPEVTKKLVRSVIKQKGLPTKY